SEDDLIDFWIKAADQYVEKRTNMALMQQTFVLRLRRVLPTIYLPRPPLKTITHVKYTLEGGSEVTVAEGDRTLTIDRMLARIDLPAVPVVQLGSMEIEYVAGADDPEKVPAPLRQASYLLAAQWLTAREAEYLDPRIMKVNKKISFGVDEACKEYRVPNGTDLNGGW